MKTHSMDRVSGVFAGPLAEHFFFLCRNNSLYGSGNNEDGQLGIPAQEEILNLERLDLFLNGSISEISCGRRHSLVLLNSGHVYSFGNNKQGQLGIGPGSDPIVHTPTLVAFFRHEAIEIAKVCAGYVTSYCISKSGVLFSFGGNKHGLLGGGLVSRKSSIPIVVRLPGKARVVAVKSGYSHTIALTEDGKVISFGSAFLGRLGKIGESTKPSEVSLPSDYSQIASHVLCGYTFSLAVNDVGVIFGWGRGYHEEYGFSENNCSLTPKKLNIKREIVPSRIAAGGFHVVFSVEQGKKQRLVGWGNCSERQPVIRNSRRIAVFPMDIYRNVNHRRIVDIICGLYTTLVVTEDCKCFKLEEHGHSTDSKLEASLLLRDIKLFDSNPISEWLVEYILSEQYIDEDVRSTDSTLLVSNKSGEEVLCHVNSRLIQSRFGRTMKSLQVDDDVPLEGSDGVLATIYGKEEKLLGMEHTLTSSLDSLFSRRWKIADVIITDGVEEQFADKFILIARRLYFRAMFGGGWKESNTQAIHIETELNEAFLSYLRFLYTGRMDVNAAIAADLANFIEYFGEGCEEDLEFKLRCENALK